MFVGQEIQYHSTHKLNYQAKSYCCNPVPVARENFSCCYQDFLIPAAPVHGSVPQHILRALCSMYIQTLPTDTKKSMGNRLKTSPDLLFWEENPYYQLLGWVTAKT